MEAYATADLGNDSAMETAAAAAAASLAEFPSSSSSSASAALLVAVKSKAKIKAELKAELKAEQKKVAKAASAARVPPDQDFEATLPSLPLRPSVLSEVAKVRAPSLSAFSPLFLSLV